MKSTSESYRTGQKTDLQNSLPNESQRLIPDLVRPTFCSNSSDI